MKIFGWRLWFFKAITYRIICFIVTVTMAYLITGSIVEAGWISFLTQSVLFFIYPLHEYLWRHHHANQ